MVWLSVRGEMVVENCSHSFHLFEKMGWFGLEKHRNNNINIGRAKFVIFPKI